MLREPELAADLTQDAFIKAYKNYDTLEKPENARAWLYQIAHRVALDEIRRRKIIRFFPWTGESHGSAPSAERLVMDANLSGDMQRALARIPERQRAARPLQPDRPTERQPPPRPTRARESPPGACCRVPLMPGRGQATTS
jgi:RNA polymerase sigma factor (sigma-70 family)